MTCRHLATLHPVPARTEGCEECLRSSSHWVNLRLCLGCGHVGCCDDSPNRHATRHALHSGHPVVASWQPGETWGWCFTDQLQFEVPEEFRALLRPPA
jgi:Zn-finger in ubiquitin-hydrolases and other protein